MKKQELSRQLKRQVTPSPAPAPLDDYHRQGLIEGFITFMVQKKGFEINSITDFADLPFQMKVADTSDNLTMRIKKLNAQATADTPDWQITIATVSGSVLSTVTGVAAQAGIITVATPLLLSRDGVVGATGVTIAYGGSHFSLYLKDRVQDYVEQAIITGSLTPYDGTAAYNEIYHHIPVTNTQLSRLSVTNTDGTYPRVIYESATGTETTVQDVATGILSLKETSSNPTFFDNVEQIGVVLPDGEFPAFIGTKRSEILNASTYIQSVEIYAGKGTDTLYGGKGNDHHVPDEGDDLMVDPEGFDTYHIDSDNGNPIIEDLDNSGQLIVTAQRLGGVAHKVKDTYDQWVLYRDDMRLFVLTKSSNGTRSATGVDLVITEEAPLGETNHSITIRNFPFYPGTGLGIGLNTKVSDEYVVSDPAQPYTTYSHQDYPTSLCTINERQFAQVWYNPDTTALLGKIYTYDLDGFIVNELPFSVAQNATLVRPHITTFLDKLAIAYVKNRETNMAIVNLGGVVEQNYILPSLGNLSPFVATFNNRLVVSNARLESSIGANDGVVNLGFYDEIGNQLAFHIQEFYGRKALPSLSPSPYTYYMPASRIVILSDRIAHLYTEHYQVVSDPFYSDLMVQTYSPTTFSPISSAINVIDRYDNLGNRINNGAVYDNIFDASGRQNSVTGVEEIIIGFNGVYGGGGGNLYIKLDAVNLNVTDRGGLSAAPAAFFYAQNCLKLVPMNEPVGFRIPPLNLEAFGRQNTNNCEFIKLYEGARTIRFATTLTDTRTLPVTTGERLEMLLRGSVMTLPYGLHEYRIGTTNVDQAVVQNNTIINLLAGSDEATVQGFGNEVHLGFGDLEEDILTIERLTTEPRPGGRRRSITTAKDSCPDFYPPDRLILKGYSYSNSSDIPYATFQNGTSLFLEDGRKVEFPNLTYSQLFSQIDLAPRTPIPSPFGSNSISPTPFDFVSSETQSNETSRNAAIAMGLIFPLLLFVFLGALAYKHREKVKSTGNNVFTRTREFGFNAAEWTRDTAISLWERVSHRQDTGVDSPAGDLEMAQVQSPAEEENENETSESIDLDALMRNSITQQYVPPVTPALTPNTQTNTWQETVSVQNESPVITLGKFIEKIPIILKNRPEFTSTVTFFKKYPLLLLPILGQLVHEKAPLVDGQNIQDLTMGNGDGQVSPAMFAEAIILLKISRNVPQDPPADQNPTLHHLRGLKTEQDIRYIHTYELIWRDLINSQRELQ